MVNARALRARGTSVPHGFESHPRRLLECDNIPVFFFYLILTILNTLKFSIALTVFFGVVAALSPT